MNSQENLQNLQKSLAFLSSQLDDKQYSMMDFYTDCLSYLKEAQYNNKIPKEINLDKEVMIEYSKEDKTIYVNFSERLENFLTADGNFILNLLQNPVL